MREIPQGQRELLKKVLNDTMSEADFVRELTNLILQRNTFFCRATLREFANEMENVLAKHDPIKGESWRENEPIELLGRLQEEVEEVLSLIEATNFDEKTPQHKLLEIQNEIIDVANFCMMLWDVVRRRG